MMRTKKPSSAVILLAILGMVTLAVLLAPAANDDGTSYSTLSAGRDGTRLIYDLTRHLGWTSQRRDVPFDKENVHAPVQALIAVSLGANETHELLEHVRRGGSLLVAGIASGLADSLHVDASRNGLRLRDQSAECPNADAFQNLIEGDRPIAAIRFTRPPAADTIGFGVLESRIRQQRAAVGFPLGKGRVVVVADPDFLTNDIVRSCATQTDVQFVRMLEFLTRGAVGTAVAFDEFHHGSGIHGGSLTAIRDYMTSAPSGRMLAEIAIAGLLLLFAKAPRPLTPRDPVRIARRNPLEHADALAHAYSAVGATRTATARLLAGVRRRTRRGRGAVHDDDEHLLAMASAAAPEARSAAGLVSHALTHSIPSRELVGVASAISTIEDALTSRPPTRKS